MCKFAQANRERLKKNYFTPQKSLKDAEEACPGYINKEHWRWLLYSYWSMEKEMKRSEKNKANARSMKIRSACGAKSTARIINEMELAAEREDDLCGTVENPPDEDDVPAYIKLWTRTKKHPDGFDEEGEAKLREFQKLHDEQIEKEGVDNLTVEEAYQSVLGYRSGYARGLGKGHPIIDNAGKKSKAQMEAEIQRLTQREGDMQSEIVTLRLEVQRKEEEALERERQRAEEHQALEDRLRRMEAKFEEFSSWANTGKFVLKLAYNHFRNKNQVNSVYNYLWDPAIMPHHSFITCMASQGRLLTVDNLKAEECTSPTDAPFATAKQNHRHLFFNCSYSAAVWQQILLWIGRNRLGTTLQHELICMKKYIKGKQWHKKLFRCALATTVSDYGTKETEEIFRIIPYL